MAVEDAAVRPDAWRTGGESADVAPIRCELDRAHAHLAGPLLRSFVHHHCALVDCDVDTVDALQDAADVVIAEVGRRRGTVTEIEFVPDPDGVDIRLSIDDGCGSGAAWFPLDPVVAADAFGAEPVPDGRLRLVHRFDDRGER